MPVSRFLVQESEVLMPDNLHASLFGMTISLSPVGSVYLSLHETLNP